MNIQFSDLAVSVAAGLMGIGLVVGGFALLIMKESKIARRDRLMTIVAGLVFLAMGVRLLVLSWHAFSSL